LSRLARVDVYVDPVTGIGYVGTPPADYDPPPAIDHIVFAYEDGRQAQVTAYDVDGHIISDNSFDYDGRGNLTAEHQWHCNGAELCFTPGQKRG
jgi:hypothetical protein